MKRQQKLSLHEAINLRDFFPEETRPDLRKSWVGTCEEILAALEGDKDHFVEHIDSRRVIYRHGYPYPHFIEVQGAAFCCPWWR